jgi:hypothetical protein
LLNLCKRLLDIFEDILHIFDTNRETDQVGGDTCLAQLFVTELTVGVRGGMQHAGAGISHVGHDVDHLQ